MIFSYTSIVQASAWLNTSKDPIHGNDKKSDSFWGQITKEFNQNNQRDHYRDTNSLKIYWTRLSKMINEFNGFCLLCECELLLLYLLCECHCHPEFVTFAGECEQLLNLQVSATVFQSWCWFLSSRHLYC